MITGVFARLKPESFKWDDGDPPVSQYFKETDGIVILGRVYKRRQGMPDLYLAKKTKEEDGDTSSWAALQHFVNDMKRKPVIGIYESYDGNPLSFHAPAEKEYMWLMEKNAEIYTSKSAIARRALEQWDN